MIAEVASYLPGVERPRGNAMVYAARDTIEAARFFSAIVFLDPS